MLIFSKGKYTLQFYREHSFPRHTSDNAPLARHSVDISQAFHITVVVVLTSLASLSSGVRLPWLPPSFSSVSSCLIFLYHSLQLFYLFLLFPVSSHSFLSTSKDRNLFEIANSGLRAINNVSETAPWLEQTFDITFQAYRS